MASYNFRLNELHKFKNRKIMDIDVIVLTSVVVTLFIVFFFAIFKEFKTMDTQVYRHSDGAGPLAGLVDIMGKLTDETKVSKVEKEIIQKVMTRTIADMESDGVYFDENIKDLLNKSKTI